MPFDFPIKLDVKDLLVCHPEYEQKQICLYEALYRGGALARTPEIQNEMLIMRQVEKVPQFAGQYLRRKERAHYVNRIGGLVDWFVASVFPEGPAIEASLPYWDALNKDVDGLGTPFATLNRDLLRAMLVHRRAYLRVWFPVKAGEEVAQDNEDKLAARFAVVCAEEVDDWDFDRMGFLAWARLHSSCMERENDSIPASPWNMERHFWVFHTEKKTVTYTAVKKTDEDWKSDAEAEQTEDSANATHDFKTLPIFDLRAAPGHWVLDRIFDVAKAIYNREAAITWALDMQAYALPVAKTASNKALTVYGSELCALKLEPGEDFGYVSPPPTIFDPLFKDAERLSSDLYEVIQALAINAAAIPQAGRLSGDAVAQMREPLGALLKSFAQPIEEVMTRAVKAVQKYRGEEGASIELTGYEIPEGMKELELEDLRKAVEPLNGSGKKKKEKEDGEE